MFLLFRSWLTGSAQAEKGPAQHPADLMGCRFGLSDSNRSANSIILTPNQKIAAISDSLGRVIIIDIEKGVALKILKGYRDAQCSFIQVQDDRYSTIKRIERKIGLFLVIYSPKRGNIDIFSTQQFAKIASFSATKHSRLIYINYSLMGFSQPTKSKYACQFTTILLDEEGQIKEINVPFHFALNEKSSTKGRDIHLYKRLREIVRGEQRDKDVLISETLYTIKEIQTVDMKSLVVDLLLKSKTLTFEVLLECSNYIVENVDEGSDDEPVKLLKIRAKNIRSVLTFYAYMISDLNESGEDSSHYLNLAETEMNHLKNFLKCMTHEEQHFKVKFADDNSYSVMESMSIFKLTEDSKIRLQAKYDDNLVETFCKDLFGKLFDKCKNLERFRREVIKSNINTKDLFVMLIIHWVKRPLNDFSNLENTMNKLTNILYILLETTTNESLKYFWEDVREIISNSVQPFPALTAAIACKFIAYKKEREMNSQQSLMVLDDDDLEIWSRENIKWKILIGKLEDVSLLNLLIVKKSVNPDFCTLPKLDHDELDISLNFVLRRKGSVSEIVARWLTTVGIDPEMLLINNKLSELSDPSDDDLNMISTQDQRDFLNEELVFKNFNLLKNHWPYSLDPGMILANMCWEYALQWKNNLETLDYLKASVACLEAIPNFFVKLGMFNIIWKSYLNQLFKNCVKLIDRVGKVPKLALCMQDTGLSDVQIPAFLKICAGYLDTFTDVVQEMYNVPKTPLKFEPLWENGGQPLAEMAVQQTNINYDLLLAHYTLSLVFHMLSEFNIKAQKAIQNLFDIAVIKVFFIDFQEKPEVDYGCASSAITESRIVFLKRVIKCSVETVVIENNDIYCKDHYHFMSSCKLLGSIWKINMDIIKLHEIIQFLVHGFDHLAFEKFPDISDRHKMGWEILAVALKRMRNYMDKSSDRGLVFAYLTPAVTGWFEGLVSNI